MKENTRWTRTRKFFHTIHLWLGIGSALILFVVCLSGTVYTFSSEIQKLTDARLHTVDAGDERLPTERLISVLLDSLRGGSVRSMVIPEAPDAAFQISVSKDENPNAGGRGRATTYFINPYTAQILGTGETSSSAFFMFMFRLHRWLLLDSAIGRPIVGVATLIFVVIIVTGLVIWFPKKLKNWRQGLKIKTSGNWKRINHDLHTSLGLYASLFLLLMALTGLTWSFEWYKQGFRKLFAVTASEKREELVSIVNPGSTPATIATYVLHAAEAFGEGGDLRISLPSDSTGTVIITRTQNGFFSTSVGDRATLDQYSAAVLHVDRFRDKALGDKIVASVKALHIGSFYGTFSKIIYFVTCLIGTSLPVTGIVIWINKLRKKNRKALKKAVPDPAVR